jgi:uncharacterized membrane protein YkvA (DUF1232 family)
MPGTRPDSGTEQATWRSRLKTWAGVMRRDAVALWLAARDPEVPWYAKVLAALIAGYALSPIDPIPDFIPILGWLDELVVVPAGVALVVALVPRATMERLRREASLRLDRPSSRLAAAGVVIGWLALAVGAGWLAWPWLRAIVPH